MKKIIYTISGLTLLLALGFASVASAETTTEVTASTTVRTEGSRPMLKRLLNDKASTTVRTEGSRPLNGASTTRQKIDRASSTNPALIEKMKDRGNKEIDRRVESLTKLLGRISEMKKISETDKAKFSADIQAEITKLANLKAKIDADTDTETLKADIKSIADSYRIYALIMPQIAIRAAADRINHIVDSFTTLSAKLQARITAAQTAGKDVSASVTALAEINTKVAEAKAQAALAISGISSLTPDNGDKAKAEANRAALVAARANIKTASTALKAARASAETIIKATKGLEVRATTTATTTTP